MKVFEISLVAIYKSNSRFGTPWFEDIFINLTGSC